MGRSESVREAAALLGRSVEVEVPPHALVEVAVASTAELRGVLGHLEHIESRLALMRAQIEAALGGE